uniref:hypothetical protein n=1 Tax=Hafnia alvei TaxID=569 RepID=UPI001C113495
PRATGLSSVAFGCGVMETHLLTGERNLSLQSHRGLAFQTGAKIHPTQLPQLKSHLARAIIPNYLFSPYIASSARI